MSNSATPWIAARQASLSITNSQSSLRLTSIESVMPSSHLILCRPLLLLSPIPPSISLFQWVNSSHEVAKVLEFHLQHHSLQRTTRADLLQNYLNSKTEMISHEVFLVKWNDRCESLSRVPAFYYYLLILFNFKLKTSKIFENVDVDLAIIELLLLILFWLQVSIYY